jgi:hypothetical protein
MEHEVNLITQPPSIVPKRSLAAVFITSASIFVDDTYQDIRDGRSLELFWPLVFSLAAVCTPFVLALIAAAEINIREPGKFKQTFWRCVKYFSWLTCATILLFFGGRLVSNYLEPMIRMWFG